MEKILVTGGAGFIGSNLIESLLGRGKQVVCLDDFSTGKRANLESFLEHPAFTLIEGDIRDLGTCKTACEGVDAVLHQAALGSVPRSIKDPVRTNSVNIDGFLNMLIAARDAQIKRFVYAASSSTYGDSESLPKVEDVIGKPLSPYAVTKYVNELYADVFSKLYGIETIGLRYFNVFGRRQDPDGAYAAVIPLFIKKLIEHESPVINGDGSYTRDFTYIDNVIQANLLALEATDQAALNTVYNVAYGEHTSLNEVAEILKQRLSVYDADIQAVPIQYGPVREGDIPHSLADISKARRLLGYQPEYDFGRGIEASVDWYYHDLKNLSSKF